MLFFKLHGYTVNTGCGPDFSHITFDKEITISEPSLPQLLAGAAVCIVLYSSFYETGRLVKQQCRPQRALPIALSVNTGLAFLAFFALGIVLTLMTGNV